MSPSRGLLKPSILHPKARYFATTLLPRSTTTFNSLSSSSLPLQIYISTTNSPHLNLSLEHHLFTTSPPSTTTLLFYTNTPSIILGRNQNPWLETNHPLLLDSPTISLLRRRSGGGTVFHDLGNVNYSVAMPTPSFSRDKHAEMVVCALRSLGVNRSVVNKRHDVVLLPPDTAPETTKMEEETPEGTKKLSGSAYKLTRLRSYHHGTMLLSSDLASVSKVLKSPAKDHLTAKGVESVSSPVANADVGKEEFVAATVDAFRELYKGSGDLGVAYVGVEEAEAVDGIRKGAAELRSPEWTYGQTPRFVFRIPGVGEVRADKGVIGDSCLEGLEGKRFGGSVIKEALERWGEIEKALWVGEVLGKGGWGG